jgi:hypothetical protein
MNIPNYSTGNGTRDFPALSAVPQTGNIHLALNVMILTISRVEIMMQNLARQ